MANTPSKNLNVPAHGSFANTWDVPVNENWNALDAALGGTTVLNVTGASGVITLTAGQYTPPNIEIFGTLTSAVNYQIPSTVGGFWSIANATSGAFTVTISAAGEAASVILPQAVRTAVIREGGNGMVLFSSNLGAGGSNTQVQYNSGGRLAGSAGFTFDGTNLALPGNPTVVLGATPKQYVDAGDATTLAAAEAFATALAPPAASESVAGIAKIATQAIVRTGTDDATIVAPLHLLDGFTITGGAGAGSIVFPGWFGTGGNGLKINWLTSTLASQNDGPQTMSWTTPFVSAIYLPVATLINAGADVGTSGDQGIQLVSWSATQVVTLTQSYGAGGTDATQRQATVIAIGV